MAGCKRNVRVIREAERRDRLFEQADFGMVNLENAFGNKEDGEPIIKSGPNLVSEDGFIEYIQFILISLMLIS